MNKKTESVNNAEEVEEVVVKEKILVFNPAGFIAKMIFSIVFAVLMTKNRWQTLEGGLFYMIFDTAGIFAVMYSVASFFGFVLRLTRNYLIAFVLFVVAIGGYGCLEGLLGETGKMVFDTALFLLVVAILANDIRKAILYFKHTL